MDFLTGEYLNELGVIGALFIIILVFLKLESRKTQTFINAETKKWEVRDRQQDELYRSIINQVNERAQKDYLLLKDTLDDNRDQVNILRSLVERTKTMQQQSDAAFRDLFEKVSKILENRCVNHLKQNEK